ncbi:MAG TPA: FAD-dependent oxidoreductase, partial [Candidatus Binataceae bacterium]|nr:FAD-dependent oxidoreductase [Candidatus Binataceae bacterium]
MAAPNVVVIGGGFAGLAAAVDLARRGIPVTVLEGKPALGGRAYSFEDPASGDTIDNGQHVLMGCYAATLDFLGVIGAADGLVFQRDLEIEMLAPGGRAAVLRTAHLPGPLHMSAALLRYGHLSLGERLSVVRGGLRLLAMRRNERATLEHMTVAVLMDVLHQSEQARRAFWYPLAIATLNDLPELSSAALLAEVLKRAFFARRSDSAFVYPRRGLSALYCAPAREFIERRGGKVMTRAIVERLEPGDGPTVANLKLRDGAQLEASQVISAVGPEALLRMLPEPAVAEPFFARLRALESSPIV